MWSWANELTSLYQSGFLLWVDNNGSTYLITLLRELDEIIYVQQLVYSLVQMLTIITTIIAIIIQIVKRPKLLCTVNKVGMGCKIKISPLLAQNLEKCLKFTP